MRVYVRPLVSRSYFLDDSVSLYCDKAEPLLARDSTDVVKPRCAIPVLIRFIQLRFHGFQRSTENSGHSSRKAFTRVREGDFVQILKVVHPVKGERIRAGNCP